MQSKRRESNSHGWLDCQVYSGSQGPGGGDRGEAKGQMDFWPNRPTRSSSWQTLYTAAFAALPAGLLLLLPACVPVSLTHNTGLAIVVSVSCANSPSLLHPLLLSILLSTTFLFLSTLTPTLALSLAVTQRRENETRPPPPPFSFPFLRFYILLYPYRRRLVSRLVHIVFFVRDDTRIDPTNTLALERSQHRP